MSENVNIILWGLLVVFLVLYLVTLVGRGLIYFTNLVEAPQINSAAPGTSLSASNKAGKPEISSKTVAAATATVDYITEGKGVITEIKKVKNAD
jgi:hypothetical protein